MLTQGDKKFYIAFAVIFLLAFSLRAYDLGGRFYNWDEGLNIWFTMDLVEDGVHTFNPQYHGPFHYFPSAFIFSIGGFSEATFRILPLLFGLALVGLALLARRVFGNWPALRSN